MWRSVKTLPRLTWRTSRADSIDQLADGRQRMIERDEALQAREDDEPFSTPFISHLVLALP